MTFFSFDTSSVLNGRRDLLPPVVFRSVWLNVEAAIASGDVRSIDVVRDELSKRDDEVHAWARTQGVLFVPLDEAVQRATREVLASHPKLMGRGGGRNAADPFVIGLAMARGGVVVTEETMSGNLANKPRIPDVCQALGVPWTNLVGFLQQQGYSY
ncbi:DUF4411 family protein [Jatrophihabitans lederbergiae]|uniref:DUF4411 family protein n=1 Tax=Jatrophihabitans lederbergiae TaxID=3075547 RepID=A0ABU2J8P5_9ACTN|nr:DUF4411 family protein [Jatrophihabitans sp. DSM 44399]MDT0261356.1 DUF4411 family protein [Jatrophihabitans sp. DSM 44399]